VPVHEELAGTRSLKVVCPCSFASLVPGTQKLQLEFFLRVSEEATMFSEKHNEMCQQAMAISGVCTIYILKY
jgi:hypothetical protein